MSNSDWFTQWPLTEVWLWLGLGALLGALVVALLLKRSREIAIAAAFDAGVQQAHQAQLDERAEREQAMDSLQARYRALELEQSQRQEMIRGFEKQLADVRASLETKQRELADVQVQAAASQATLSEAQRGFAQREAMLKETSSNLKKEFASLASQVFESQEEKHSARLQTVLSPFREQIVDFRKRVEEVYHTDTKERASLLSEIKNLQQASERINEEAENLTKALKGDKKLQGNWGELVLERVLQDSGLRRNHEYVVQPTHRSEQGDLKRPDVVIRLPEDKDVVVDSKVSLNAYEEALAQEDESLRDQLLKQHLANLRTHVKRLSEQDYDQLPDVRSLDFVLMFVPIESAFTLAMETDHRLFTEAFAQRIVVVSPTTLMMTLRIINNVWRYEKQNRNAQEIARRAGALYDKLRVLVEDMTTLGRQLGTAEKTYQGAFAKLTTGRGNLVRQAEQFRELGAQVKKPIDAKLIERAEQDTPEGQQGGSNEGVNLES